MQLRTSHCLLKSGKKTPTTLRFPYIWTNGFSFTRPRGEQHKNTGHPNKKEVPMSKITAECLSCCWMLELLGFGVGILEVKISKRLKTWWTCLCRPGNIQWLFVTTVTLPSSKVPLKTGYVRSQKGIRESTNSWFLAVSFPARGQVVQGRHSHSHVKLCCFKKWCRTKITIKSLPAGCPYQYDDFL